MSQIKNLQGLSIEEINLELSRGAKFVVFQYCISIIFLSFKRGSDIYFIKSGESAVKHSVGYTLISVLLGWWGLPWGPIYTCGSLYTNVKGGKDVTTEVLAHINSHS